MQSQSCGHLCGAIGRSRRSIADDTSEVKTRRRGGDLIIAVARNGALREVVGAGTATVKSPVGRVGLQR